MTRPADPQPYPGDVVAAAGAEEAAPVTTRPEQPIAYPGDALLPGMSQLRRMYRDPLGRPMTGTATITGSARFADAEHVVLPAPVKVEIVDGLLAAYLSPGTYDVSAVLVSADGSRISDQETVTL